MDPTFNAKDQRVLVKYLHFMRNNPTDIHKLMTAACGKDVADYKIMKGWIQELCDGNEDNEEETHTEGPNGIPVNLLPVPTDPAMVTRVEYLITNDKRISMDRLSEMAQINKASIHSIITNVLGLKRVCERWVPRLWTPEQRTFRVEVAKELLDRYDTEGENFLKKIVVGDETFIHYYLPDKIHVPTHPYRRLSKGIAEERYKPNIEPIGVSFIFFYDCQGMLCMNQVPENKTANAEYYSEFIRNEVIPAIKRKRKGVNIKDLYLLHDNTPVHNALVTRRTLRELELETLPHSPASPDMEPIEFFLINHLKSQMRGTPFHNGITIGATISHHLVALSENSFYNSIKKLVGRWEHCVDSRGLYQL